MNHHICAMDSYFLSFVKWSIVGVLGLLATAMISPSAYGQAGLRVALEKLDKNQNGQIDPSEITPQARPYIERITKNQSRSWKEREISIERLTDIARRYYYAKNGGNERELRPEGESSVKSFSPEREQELVPEFGLGVVKYPYIRADLDLARQVMGSYDRNRDGFIDRREAGQARKWTHRNPFDDDLNKDERISVMELTQRYARRRLVESMSQELEQKRERVGSDARPAYRRPGSDSQGNSRSSGSRSRGASGYLAANVLGRFDSNRNGRLELYEAQNLGIPSGRIDLNQDGVLAREELDAYFRVTLQEVVNETDGLPDWFVALDQNRDRQVSMGEFTSEWTDAKLKEFTGLDRNGDGLVTAMELLQSNSLPGGSYVNKNGEIIPPRRVAVSEIEVTEDYLIGDLNLQISVTHTYLSKLDGYLTGPDGQRIELFTEVGGSDDHFDKTIFDDQSAISITKARWPYQQPVQPGAVLKQQPSLSHFNGKSVKGVWQLTIRGTRSERFGMLNSWALIVQPQGQVTHRDTAPLGTPAPPRPAAESRPSSGASGPSRSSSGGRSDSGQQPDVSKRAEEIRRNWTKMSPEEQRRAKEEMAKRGLRP
ncbi:MAG: proprotein convertase P-domain-containing protein, partial [Pirellulaceae bacterium]